MLGLPRHALVAIGSGSARAPSSGVCLGGAPYVEDLLAQS